MDCESFLWVTTLACVTGITRAGGGQLQTSCRKLWRRSGRESRHGKDLSQRGSVKRLKQVLSYPLQSQVWNQRPLSLINLLNKQRSLSLLYLFRRCLVNSRHSTLPLGLSTLTKPVPLHRLLLFFKKSSRINRLTMQSQNLPIILSHMVLCGLHL